MKKLLALLALSAVATLVAPAAHAENLYLGVGLSHGTADFALENAGFSSAYDHSEYGIKLDYWNMMAKDYALTTSFNLGRFSELQQPGNNAPANAQDFKYSQASWSVRVGGDRVERIGERGFLFFGPGIEYWNGTAKFKTGANTFESEHVTRISLSGRIGAAMMLNGTTGLQFTVGSKVGRANYTELGAKTTWYPSSTEGSMGLVFKFGSKH
jgi:hypothetical protein